MGATLAGEARGDQGEAEAQAKSPSVTMDNPKNTSQNQQEGERKSQEQDPDQGESQEQEWEQELLEPQLVRGKSSKSRGLMSAIEDIQRMPEEAIFEEFNRLLLQAQRHVIPLSAPPCQDVAAKMQSCLKRHSQRSCDCFNVMEQYRHCVIRATQTHLDDQADDGPPSFGMVRPQPMPHPAVPAKRSQRRWYKFWTWFR